MQVIRLAHAQKTTTKIYATPNFQNRVIGELGGRVIITAMTAGIATAVLGTLHDVKYNPAKLRIILQF